MNSTGAVGPPRQVLLSPLGTGTSRTTCRRPLPMGPSLIFAYLVREYLRRSPQNLTKLGVSVRRKARGRYRQIDGAVEHRLTTHSGSDGRNAQREFFLE